MLLLCSGSCDDTIEMSPSQAIEAHPDVAALEDHGDGARLANGLVEAVDFRLHQIHECRALAADTTAAGQNGQGTACKQTLSLSQTQHAQQQPRLQSDAAASNCDKEMGSTAAAFLAADPFDAAY